MNISLDTVSIIKGELGNIYVTCDGASQYTQLQIEIYDTCNVSSQTSTSFFFHKEQNILILAG